MFGTNEFLFTSRDFRSRVALPGYRERQASQVELMEVIRKSYKRSSK